MKNKKQISNIKNSKEQSLFKAGIIFFIFSTITAVFNYLYHLFMGRMLGPEQYGILGSLFALVYITTFSTSTLNLVISKYVAEFHFKEKSKVKYLFYKILSMVGIFGLIALSIFIILSPFIADFMNLPDILGLIIVGLIAYFSFLYILFTGALNGMQKFLWQNSSGLVSTLLKFSLAIILVLIGFSVNGALSAILIGILIGIYVAYIPINKELKSFKKEKFSLKNIYSYAIIVFIASVLFILFITLDQILVKHFFSSADAGIYAAAGTIAKMIWFGSSFLIGALFPKVVSMKAKGKNPSKLLSKSLIYISILVILGCAVFFVAPTFIVTTLYGHLYDNAIPLVLLFGIALGIYSLMQIFMTYNLAMEDYKFIYIFIAGIILEIISIYLFHSSLLDIVKIVLLTNIFMLICLIIYHRKDILGDFSKLTTIQNLININPE